MSLKKDAILTAQTLGFFRAKDPEKQALIFEEMMELAEFRHENHADIGNILENEVIRRHNHYIMRASKAHDKIEADLNKPLTGGVDNASGHVEKLTPGVYVLTTAQNNTDVDPIALGALLSFCKIHGARLMVAKTTYNKNGFQQSQDTIEGVYYAPEIVPYLVEGQSNLGGDIEFIGQANVLPTAKNPLSGFEGITPVGVSVVIPATKIALKCTAALKGGKPKILFSTGTVTKRNYIMRKSGAVAASDHNIGALLVDTTGYAPIVRQLEVMPGSNGFYDHNTYYDADGGVTYGQYPVALQLGDVHAEKMTAENLASCKALINFYGPDHVILHDVMDFSSRNHHNTKDCAFLYAQTVQNNTVEHDIRTVALVIDQLAGAYKGAELGINPMVHIIESNHDLAINTWLKNADYKLDPVNALVYLQCTTALYKHIQKTGNTDFNMLQFAYTEIGEGLAKNVVFHETDESLIIAGVEMGCHGHTGTNGSRGSPAQFRALGVAMNTGHTHTPSILGACYTAGVTGSLEMGYNIGASSWQLANILTWPNGQRQVIFM